MRPRVIPCLLLRGNGLVKTRQFKDASYVGDPINAVRIFSEKEVDEIVVLDIDATKNGCEPNYSLIEEIAGECFMPLAYGGGVSTVEQARKLIRSGVEKIVINSASTEVPGLINELSKTFGKQAVVAAIDIRTSLLRGRRIWTHSASVETKIRLKEHINNLVFEGAGELFINSIDRDGMMQGYDIPLIKEVVETVDIPIIACGGAGNMHHLVEAIQAGASGVAAGSLFIFYGKHQAVLISYPDAKALLELSNINSI
jgi:cyclase